MNYFFVLLLKLIVCNEEFETGFNSIRAGSGFDENFTAKLYESLDCKDLSYSVFKIAYKGYVNIERLKLHENKRFLTIIDYNKSIFDKRFFVIDLRLKKVIFKEYVSHALMSGKLYAKSFSNMPNSKKSCFGFFLTGRTYHNKTGYALKLFGLDNGFNDNAFNRGIVIHETENIAENYSKGCFTLSNNVCTQIIDTIKNGSCVFVYIPNKIYFKRSIFLNS